MPIRQRSAQIHRRIDPGDTVEHDEPNARENQPDQRNIKGLARRGVSFEDDFMDRHFGEALLAGQLYLAANWNATNGVIDNFEWYHLQGDPAMLLNQ